MGPPVGQALEFLSQVLSQRGPQAVPYAENVKWSIREHMSDLLKVRGGWRLSRALPLSNADAALFVFLRAASGDNSKRALR